MPEWNDHASGAGDRTWLGGPTWDDDPGWTYGSVPSEGELSLGRDTSQGEPPRPKRGLRRAVLGSIAGVLLLVGPVALANAVVPDDGTNVEAADDHETSFLAAVRQDTEQVQEVNEARMDSALALQPTTTVVKEPVPTTTTTTAPTTTAAPNTTAAPSTTSGTPATTEGAPPASSGDDSVWDQLAQCESGGNWHINTGNGYYGGLQFALSTWQSVGGTGYPHEHSRETQIEMGKRLQARAGWGQWPSCASKLGLI
jgi:hypothetical protein